MAGLLYAAMAIFLIIAGILAILMPFFVLRIRNEIISMNQKLSLLIQLLERGSQRPESKIGTPGPPPIIPQ